MTWTPRQSRMLSTSDGVGASSAIATVQRRVCTQQPQQGAQVDLGNQFGGRVIDALVGAAHITQQGKLVTRYGAVAQGVYGSGVGFRSASNGGVSFPSSLTGNNAITLVFEFVQHSRVGLQILAEHSANFNVNAGTFIMYTDVAAGNLSFGTGVSGGYDAGNLALSSIPAPGAITRIAMRLRFTTSTVATDDVGIAINGVMRALSPQTSTPGAMNFGNFTTYLLGRAGTSFQCDATLGLYAVLAGFPSDAELASLSANPWQIFAPKSSPIWVPA